MEFKTLSELTTMEITGICFGITLLVILIMLVVNNNPEDKNE